MSKTFRRKEELGRYKFITPHILEEIWTDELLADLFAGTELSGGSWLPRLKDGHLKILSILVVISWSKWDQFKDIFINHPGRTDQDLPLDESAIDGTYFDKAQLEKFVESQSRFLPTTIIENRDIDCRFEFQMPFETQPKRISEKGSYSSVEKVVIVSGHYEDRERGINVNVSTPLLSQFWRCVVFNDGPVQGAYQKDMFFKRSQPRPYCRERQPQKITHQPIR